LYLTIGAGLAVLVYYGQKSINATPPPPGPIPPNPASNLLQGLSHAFSALTGSSSSSTPSSSGTPAGGGGPAPKTCQPWDTTTVCLLYANSNARKIFAFQSALYSYGITDQAPDGIWGPITAGLVTRVNQATQNGNSSVLNDNVLRSVNSALHNLSPSGDQLPSPRLIPQSLPQDLIDQINGEVQAIAPDFPYLQATGR